MQKKTEIEICEGCSKADPADLSCSVYADKTKTWGYRMGQCAFNMKSVMTQRRRKRVGQQKQRKGL